MIRHLGCTLSAPKGTLSVPKGLDTNAPSLSVPLLIMEGWTAANTRASLD